MKDYSVLTKEEKDMLVQKAREAGYQYENRYGNCPQCTLAALSDVFPDLGIDDKLFKALYCLGGGVARTTQGTCGALSAAAAAVSLVLGRERQNMEEEPHDCMKVAEKVFDRFVEKYGGPRCCDVQTALFGRNHVFIEDGETEAYFEAGGHNKCGHVVEDTAGWVAELIVSGEVR